MPENHQHRIFQIFYDQATKAGNDKGFLPLNNLSNQRPDWSEYWPIRNHLIHSRIESGPYYGFFSPRFMEKTGLSSEQVFDFLNGADEDIISFSPYLDQAAFFLNVFEQGSCVHNNQQHFVDAFNIIDPQINIANMINTSRDSVFCNYFVAKKHVWDAWLDACEKIYSICEANESPLANALNGSVKYDGTKINPSKVFVIERVISFLINQNKNWRVKRYNPMRLPFTQSRIAAFPKELVELDALKIAYCVTGFPEYMQIFQQLRAAIVKKAKAG